MKTNNHYPKIVEWSDEDQCYIGSCSGLIYGGSHGDVDGWIEIYKRENLELPLETKRVADLSSSMR